MPSPSYPIRATAAPSTAGATRGGERRRAILVAALHAFTEHGFDGATIDDIRRRSGASVGSIYHFFSGKEAIAAALYREGIEEWTGVLRAAIRSALSAEDVVRGAAAAYFDWATSNPDWYFFLIDLRDLALGSPSRDEIFGLVDATERDLAQRLSAAGEAGVIAHLTPSLYWAMVFGPVLSFLMIWGRRGRPPLGAARSALIEAAWQSLALR